MDRATRNLALAGLTRDQLIAAVARVHDALYLEFAEGGFAYAEGKEWSPDTLDEVAAAVNDLPGLRPD